MTDLRNSSDGACNRTVFALATPAQGGHVAVVRLSGPLSSRVATSLGASSWKRSGVSGELQTSLGLLPLHLWCMPAPHTYTGQDTLEVFMPSHQEVITDVTRWLEAKGCKQADAGEFTRLAVESGRLDLSRAEAVMALVTAHDDATRRRALADLSGASSKILSAITDDFRKLSARYEMLFDFSEEEHAEAEELTLAADLGRLKESLSDFVGLNHAITNKSPTIALCGPPNAGKSSLFNALLGEPRSLVSDLPGTTRDAVQNTIHISEISAELIDLSGVGQLDTDSGAFSTKSTSLALEADILLALGAPDNTDESIELFRQLEAQDAAVRGRAVWVKTMSDSSALLTKDPLGLEQVTVSAITGSGIDDLRSLLGQRLRDNAIGNAVSLQRQKADEASRVFDELDDIQQLPPEAVAQHVRYALRLLDEALLSDNPGDVLDLIFSRFCIGK
ncbi:50S ribosome-binding GTPase [Planctomycetota bacterium]|nr:50S ribosome-binding GTPase [Planctomycetota bacterium]